MGINTSLIKYPTNPITANPIAQLEAICKYSDIILKYLSY